VAQAAGDGVTAGGPRRSTIFDALRVIRDAIADADWPTHGDTLEAPDVGIGFYESADVPAEVVQVVDRVDDDAEIAWQRMTGRRETYLLDIVIDSWVPGQSRDAACDRLAELAGVVQDVFHDTATGTARFPTSPTWVMEGTGTILRVTCQVQQSTEGWGGRSTVSLTVTAII
jgi:hypothetical protein